MGMFIEVRVNRDLCGDPSTCQECARVCPVDVYVIEGDRLQVDHDNEDECTLCELCVQACPEGAIMLHRLYEPKQALPVLGND